MKLSVTLLLCVLIHQGLSAPPRPIKLEEPIKSEKHESSSSPPPGLCDIPPFIPKAEPSGQDLKPVIHPSRQQGPHSPPSRPKLEKDEPSSPPPQRFVHQPSRDVKPRIHQNPQQAGPSQKRSSSQFDQSEQLGLASPNHPPGKRQHVQPQLAGLQLSPAQAGPSGRYRKIAPRTAPRTSTPPPEPQPFGCSHPDCQGKGWPTTNAYGRHVTDNHMTRTREHHLSG